MNESNEPKLSMNRRDALKGSQQCGDCSHLTDLRGAKDWDGFGATFQSPAWPISFFTAARWGRIFELIGGGVVCVFLVHQNGPQVLELNNKLVDQVYEMFPVY